MAVVTQPDRPAGRGHKLVATPVKRKAQELGIPVLTPERLRSFAGEVRALGPDAFVVASYGKIVPLTLLDVVPIAFNVHPSLLPLYRGATPLQSAIRDGRDETGVSIIAMDAGMDTGDVLLQERVPIGERETYGELHDRTAEIGARMVLDAIDRHERGTLTRTPQSAMGVPEAEISATLTHPLRKDDLVIDWAQEPARVVDLVRSLSPQPLARTTYGTEPLKIVEARILHGWEPGKGRGSVRPPGPTVYLSEPPIFGVCYPSRDDVLAIERLIPPNRGPMTGEAFARRKAQEPA